MVQGGRWVHRFTRDFDGRNVASMMKCVNQILPVSFIKCMKAPCGEITGIFRCGKYKLGVFHYQPFIFFENSAAFYPVVGSRGKKLGW